MHEIEGLYELNIGHSIISRAVFTGLPEAVSKMAELIK
jgi:pyridoxine 5-phosphate synthase